MSPFETNEFKELREKLKAEFPINPKAPAPLHQKLHEALDSGSNQCLYYISQAINPIPRPTLPLQTARYRQQLYEEFMHLYSLPLIAVHAKPKPILDPGALIMA